MAKDLELDRGILLVENSESIAKTSIHMFFMRYDLTVLWLDKEFRIVDKVLARKWAPYYASKRPAKYVAEVHPGLFSQFAIGEPFMASKPE